MDSNASLISSTLGIASSCSFFFFIWDWFVWHLELLIDKDWISGWEYRIEILVESPNDLFFIIREFFRCSFDRNDYVLPSSIECRNMEEGCIFISFLDLWESWSLHPIDFFSFEKFIKPIFQHRFFFNILIIKCSHLDNLKFFLDLLDVNLAIFKLLLTSLLDATPKV